MSEKLFKGKCGTCNGAFLFPFSQIPLHVVEPGMILCWRCCKKEHWHPGQLSRRCRPCIEKTMCKGNFLNNLKKGLARLEGI